MDILKRRLSNMEDPSAYFQEQDFSMLPEGYTERPEEEAILDRDAEMKSNQAIQDAINTPGVVESGQIPQSEFDAIRSTQPDRQPATTPQEPTLSREELLIKQIQDMQSKSDEDIKAARKDDRNAALLNAVMPSLQGFHRARALSSARSVGADPGAMPTASLPTGSAKDLMADRSTKLKEMLEMSKLQQPKGTSPLDLAKIKEMEAKTKLYESKASPVQDKESAKEDVKIRTENRKEKKQLETDIQSTEKLLKNLEDTKKEFETYSKSTVAGTGPIATLGGSKKYFDSKLETLDSRFKEQNLDTMSKLFQGMSKAVDSESERRAFEAAQPSITNDDVTNKQILSRRIEAAKELLKKQKCHLHRKLFSRCGHCYRSGLLLESH
jgi:hypothetical protein